MKKRWCSLLLALTLLLLCGCSGNTDPAGSSGNTDPAGSNGTTPAATTVDLESNIYHQKVMEQMYDPPVYDGEPLIPYDPDRQVYISLSNQDCDFYADYGSDSVAFWIITREHYNEDDIQVHIETSAKYEVNVTDMTESCQELSHNAFYPTYGLQRNQYICMQQPDWQELARSAIYNRIVSDFISRTDPESEERAGYAELLRAYWDVFDAYETQYLAVNMDTMPKFSAYRVGIYFRELSKLDSTEEVVDTVEFEVGGTTYTQHIGQWRLHNSTPQEIIDAIPAGVGVTATKMITTGLGTPAMADGIEILPGLFYVETTEDLTLTGIRQFETGDRAVNILGAKVWMLDKKIWKEEGREVVLMEFLWDPNQPLDIAADSLVKIDLYVQDERLKNFDGCFTAFFFLDYAVRNQTDSILNPARLCRLNEPVWDTYLMAFEGIDLGEYYNVYYASTLAWRKELPEGWLQ